MKNIFCQTIYLPYAAYADDDDDDDEASAKVNIRIIINSIWTEKR